VFRVFARQVVNVLILVDIQTVFQMMICASVKENMRLSFGFDYLLVVMRQVIADESRLNTAGLALQTASSAIK